MANNQLVMKYFKKIAEIPHASFHEEAIGSYLLEFAKEHNLEAKRDDAGNVYIRKPATSNKELPIILQGHMDMVAAKEENVDFNFDTDSLILYEEDGFLHAKGTTLGADNGIAVAMILAILDDDSIQHSGIEAIITVQEEVGLLGAGKVDGSWFKGKTLINIDSEEEGIFTVSCCGGVRQVINLDIDSTDNQASKAYKISLEGLLGGHSGMEINKQRANALQLMARIAHRLQPCSIAEISGGVAMNAIAKDASMIITTDNDIQAKIAELEAEFKGEFGITDPQLAIKSEAVETPKKVFSKQTSENLISLLLNLPCGVIRMNPSLTTHVQTSSNIGVLRQEDNQLVIETSHRSTSSSEKNLLITKTATLCQALGATQSSHGDYPAWEYNPESNIRELFKQKYKEQSGKEAVIDAIHAGLECGILQEQIGELDMISIGPNIYDVHTPNEKLDLASTERTYQLLLSVLEELTK